MGRGSGSYGVVKTMAVPHSQGCFSNAHCTCIMSVCMLVK